MSLQAENSMIQKQLQLLARQLLINELCEPNENDMPFMNYSYVPVSKGTEAKSQHPNYNAAYYLSPFFMKSSERSTDQIQQESIKECIKNSKQSQNLQILLKNVLQLPKLRYQESQKLFQVQTALDDDNKSQSFAKGKRLEFSIPEQSKNLSTVRGKNVQETQTSQRFARTINSAKKSQLKDKLGFTKGKKIIDLNDEEQFDIEVNMSARSQRSDVFQTMRSQGQRIPFSQSGREKSYQQSNSFENDSVFLTESQKKAKQEKNFIQNYFQSAKNQILENCSLNCCEGMFSQEQKNNQKKKDVMILKETQNIRLKKQEKRY